MICAVHNYGNCSECLIDDSIEVILSNEFFDGLSPECLGYAYLGPLRCNLAAAFE